MGIKMRTFYTSYIVSNIFVKCVIHREVVPKEKGSGSTSRMAELGMVAYVKHSQTAPGRGLNKRFHHARSYKSEFSEPGE